MTVTARLHYLRITPRKVRLVADLIRGKSVEQAQTILNFTVKKAAQPLLKLLNSAIANARNNFQLDPSTLFISRIEVNEGPKYKRWMPRARGQASEIQKKTSHATIVLDEIKKSPKKVYPLKSRPFFKEDGDRQVKEVKEEVEKFPKHERPKPKPTVETLKPKTEKGIKRIFRRKAF